MMGAGQMSSPVDEYFGPDRRMKLDPDDARAVLAVLVQHLEKEDYLGRALDELRGTVGSVSGELGQMKGWLVDLRDQTGDVHNRLAEMEAAVKVLGGQIGGHIEQAAPIIEASEAFMVLARAGDLIWRMKWWGITAGLGVLFLVKGDVDSLMRAVAVLIKLSTHTP
jgi:hypothetical protein